MGTPADARKKYRLQRNTAKHRGIEWLFSFEEWWAVWSASGKWEQRGIGVGKYHMGRHGDQGPYAPWNVSIITHEQNVRECRHTRRETAYALSVRAIGRGRGWQIVPSGRYAVSVARAYVGTYDTQQEAEVAYAAAIQARLAALSKGPAINPPPSDSQWSDL